MQLLDAPGVAVGQGPWEPQQQHTLHASVQTGQGLVVVGIAVVGVWLKGGADLDDAQVLEAAQQPLAPFRQRGPSCRSAAVDLWVGGAPGKGQDKGMCTGPGGDWWARRASGPRFDPNALPPTRVEMACCFCGARPRQPSP